MRTSLLPGGRGGGRPREAEQRPHGQGAGGQAAQRLGEGARGDLRMKALLGPGETARCPEVSIQTYLCPSEH